jgi:uncharacterized membrane protein
MSSTAPRTLIVNLASLAVFVYPFAIYYLMGTIDPLWFGAVLIGLIALRLRPILGLGFNGFALLLFAAIFLGLLRWTGDDVVLRLYPTIINLALLGVFGFSLVRPPSMIEKIAVQMGMRRDPGNIAYTRVVTMVWCGFFAFNACVSAGVTISGSLAAWTIYNGLLSYVLIGVVFGAEFLYRQHHFRQQNIRNEVG